MINIFFSIYVFILCSCNADAIVNSDNIVIAELKKEWKHSREEETDSIQIYRPVDYKEFPASRYRQAYIFADSGKCKYLVLAPNDAHYFKNGTWSYSEGEQILIIYDSYQDVINKFKIISVTNDLLKFVKL